MKDFAEKNKNKRKKKNIWITGKPDAIIFAVLLLIYTGVMLYLFINQCYQVPDFVSDMPDYVKKVAGIQGDYEFPYPLFFWIARVFAVFSDPAMGTAIAAALLNSLGVCIAKYYMDRLVIYGGNYPDGQADQNVSKKGLFVTFMVFALFLLGNLYSPKNTSFFGFDYAYRCMGIYTPNPIWNATYMATRPFAIICFFEACKMIKQAGMKRFDWKSSLPFAIGLFLTTITKPSFTMVVVPTLGIVLIAQLIFTKGRSFTGAFSLCLTMIPTGIVLLYQFFGVFTGTNVKGEETGVAFGFAKVWSNYSKNIPLSILMGMALTMGVLVLNLPEIKKNIYYRFAWMNYLVATVMFLCLYEKGFRMLHANFSWGYMHGMFFVFMLTLVLVIKNTIEWFGSYKIIFVIAEWGVLAYHLVCGINFLIYALQGKELAGF